jgi:hypothetical protein
MSSPPGLRIATGEAWIILPARCTVRALDLGGEKCPSVVVDPSKAATGKRESISSLLKLTPPGQHVWRDTSRPSGACSNACAHTGRNRAAIRRAPTAPALILATEQGSATDHLLANRVLRPWLGR